MQTYKLLQQDSVLLSQPLLIQHFGRAGAQFLSQLHYWLEKKDSLDCKHDGTHWIYNSAESWAEQIQLSVSQFKRIIKKLSALGIIHIQKLNPHKSIRTNYYSIDYEKLSASITSQDTAVSGSFSHSVIMSQSSCHNDTIYNDTKTTNKDINKSEAKPIERAGQGKKKNKPVHQVNMIIPKDQEKKEEKLYERATSKDSFVTEPSNVEAIQTKRKTTTTKDMLEIWNTTLGEKAQASMSKDLAPLLVSAFHKKFAQSLDQWKFYCELIKTSPYLMGECFQLSIFWGLKFSTIDRLRAGELGVKPAMTNYSVGQGGTFTVTENQVEQMIEGLQESTEARSIRVQIARAIGAAAYHSWFHQATFVKRGDQLQMVAPNAFVESYWETHYSWISKTNNFN